MPLPNWFFAFPLDGSFLLALPRAPHTFRMFHPDDVHMTLAFLGACGEERALRALAALDEALARSPLAPLAISLGSVVPMGSPRRYSALSALLERGRAEAAATIEKHRDALTLAAARRQDDRAPKPHVTLARPDRRATGEDRARGIAWANALDLRPVSQTLDRIALYTWAEPRGQRKFEIVAERRLGEPVRGCGPS